MKTFKITVYPVTIWSVKVEACTEEEAKEIALNLEGPVIPAYLGDDLNEWVYDIMEWPNIGIDGVVDIEKL